MLLNIRQALSFSAVLITATVINFSMIKPVKAEIKLSELPQIKALKINNPKVITSGLPESEHFPSLYNAGIDLVINLLPTDNPNGNPNEAESAKQAGVDYVNIEVDWQNPTQEDIEHFFNVMNANKQKDILVHCAANYRASAFYYLYQVTQEKMDAEAAFKVTLTPWGNDIKQSLQEYPQWQTLLENVIAKYAGQK